MLRTRLAKAYIKRTFRPTYGWTQMTPKSVFLDPAWDRSVNTFPGFVYMRTAGENVTLLGTGGIPYGFGALYVGGDGIDEPLEAGINAFAVWVMGPDAEAELLAPAFLDTIAWTDPGNGTEVLVHGIESGVSRGKLVPAGTTGVGGTVSATPAARLLKVNSATKITIGGLR
jgi:hypothetical protein